MNLFNIQALKTQCLCGLLNFLNSKGRVKTQWLVTH
jgi:hypothetical protein